MSQHTYTVFVSSTNRDLFAHREKVRAAIERLGCHPVAMEHFGAHDGDAEEVSLKQTTGCDVFIGIYAFRYGYRPDPRGPSVTEMEYREAVQRHIPRLIFMVDDSARGYAGWTNLDRCRDTDPDSIQMLADLKTELETARVRDTFTTPDDLAAKVATALGNWLRDHPYEGWHAPAAPEIPANRRFVGRAPDIENVSALLLPGQTVSITASVAGAGGIGKTYLAQHLGHALRERFPGGVFHTTLGPDARDPESVLGQVLPTWASAHPQGRRMLEADPGGITAERVKTWLSQAPGRILAILDDVWHDAPARALHAVLPPGSACLITTRDRMLLVDLATVYPLETLSEADARALLVDRLGHLGDLETPDCRAALDELAGLVERHALALEIAAGNIRVNGLAHLLQYVADVRAAMPTASPFADLTLPYGPSARVKSVEVTLALSYDPLPDPLKARFRALGALPPEIDYAGQTVYAAWGADMDDAAAARSARDDLLRLVQLGLVRRDDTTGRCRQHALLYAYARALAWEHDEHDSALGRYTRHVIEVLAAQFRTLPQEEWDAVIGPDLPHIHTVGNRLADYVQGIVLGETPLDSLAQPDPPGDLPEIIASIGANLRVRPDSVEPHPLAPLHSARFAGWRGEESPQVPLSSSAGEGDIGGEVDPMARALLERGENFAAAVHNYVLHRRVGDEGRRWLQVGLACARIHGNRGRDGLFTSVLGFWHQHRGFMQAALAYHGASLDICRELGDQAGEAAALNNMALVYDALGEKQRALDLYEQALPVMRAVGDRAGEAQTLNNMAAVYDDLGEKQRALALYEQALPIRRAVGDRAGEAQTLNNMGPVYDALGEKQRALALYEQALPIRRAVGDRAGEAVTLNNMAVVYYRQGQPERAADMLRQVIQIVHEIGAVADEAAFMFNLAAVLGQSLGQTAEAVDLVARSIALLERYNLPQDAGGLSIEQHRGFLAQLRG